MKFELLKKWENFLGGGLVLDFVFIRLLILEFLFFIIMYILVNLVK